MQELWSDDNQIILAELTGLVASRKALTLYQRGTEPQKATATEIFPKKQDPLLLLNKDKPFPAPKEACLILYQAEGGGMRGFHTRPLIETTEKLGVLLPQTIIKIQRRKHPRYITSRRSVATFTRLGSQYLNHGSIENICLEGAKLTGKFSQHIAVGDTLSPVSMTLRLRFGDYEENITAPEAFVRRVKDLGNDNKELGIQFIVAGSDLERLESYLSIRSMEDCPPNGTGRRR